MKIHPVGAQLFHADRETNGQNDMAKPTMLLLLLLLLLLSLLIPLQLLHIVFTPS